MDYLVNMLAKPKKITTSQMDEKNVDNAMNIYLRNSTVSLCSAKLLNKDIQCILYVNFIIDTYTYEFLKTFNIKIKFLDFGKHSIGDEYIWNIANYRYDVLEDICNNVLENDRVIMLDTDTVCVHELSDLYHELDFNLLMYDVQLSSSHIDRRAMLDNYIRLYGSEANITHYGGEFIGGNGKVLKKLYFACKEVIEESKGKVDLKNFNDEHITSIAIHRNLNNDVHNANAYINRFWTGRFYLVSTNYINNAVCIWHIPNEKRYGILRIYKYFMKNGKFPDIIALSKMLGFPKCKRPFSFRFYSGRSFNRIRSIFQNSNFK